MLPRCGTLPATRPRSPRSTRGRPNDSPPPLDTGAGRVRRTSGSEWGVRVAITHHPGHVTAGEVDHLRGLRASTDNTPLQKLSFPAPGFASATWPTTFFVAWDRSGARPSRIVGGWWRSGRASRRARASGAGVARRPCSSPPRAHPSSGSGAPTSRANRCCSAPASTIAPRGRVARRAAALSPGQELLLAGE